MNARDREGTAPDEPKTGFAVIYRWRLKPGTESSFVAAWEAVTRSIRRDHGGLGSRLHLADDGTILAYAQWPDRESWDALQSAPATDPAASSAMRACIRERLEPILLESLSDLLVTAAAPGPAKELAGESVEAGHPGCRVVRAHASRYPDPVRVRYGDRVRVAGADTEFPGWVRVTDPGGRTGWAPDSILDRLDGSTARVTEDYAAVELTVSGGEDVRVHRELAGWLWVSTRDGREGWIPANAVRED